MLYVMGRPSLEMKPVKKSYRLYSCKTYRLPRWKWHLLQQLTSLIVHEEDTRCRASFARGIKKGHHCVEQVQLILIVHILNGRLIER